MRSKSVKIATVGALAWTLVLGGLEAEAGAKTTAAPSGRVDYGPDEAVTADRTATVAKTVGARTRFVLDCYDRAFRGDKGVYDDCFTEDYKMKGPETKMVSTTGDGAVHGRSAIQAYHDMNHGDTVAWGKVLFQRVWSAEVGDKVIRLMRWTSSDPKGSYAGITNIPADRTVTAEGLFVDTIRDGKIADNWFTYDTMSFLTDIAGGDMKAAAKGLSAMSDMIAASKRALEEGKPMPAPTNAPQ